MTQTKWKEYFSGGRKYYYNVCLHLFDALHTALTHRITQTDSKESKWDMPDELLLLLEKVEKDMPPNQPPATALTYEPFIYFDSFASLTHL